MLDVKSLPIRGVWIEIFNEVDDGLDIIVTPHTGSVD